MENFLGLDISLTSTGYNVVRGGKTIHEGSIKTSKDESWLERINKITGEIFSLLDRFKPKLVFIENYSFNSQFGREVLGEIHGIIMFDLLKREIPFMKPSPTQVKKFGCGSGVAPAVPPGKAKTTWKKVWVVDTVNATFDKDYRLTDNDICDSFVIALLAETYFMALNRRLDLTSVPKHQKAVLAELINPPTKKKKSRRKTKDGSTNTGKE